MRATVWWLSSTCVALSCISYVLLSNERSAARREAAAVEAERSVPLFLSDLVAAGDYAAARFRSAVVVGGLRLGHSGFFAAPSASGARVNQLFTWFQPCARDDGCRLVQWFNGGPGSPDTTGALNQIGQYWVDESLELRERCFSWCFESHCLFVDQPVETGYSFQQYENGTAVAPEDVEYTRTSADAARQVLAVLRQVLLVFPELEGADYYVEGLSYAGHYVPAMAAAVIESEIDLNLKGVAVGDPAIRHASEAPLYGAALAAFGLVDGRERNQLEAIMAESVAAWEDRGDCVAAFAAWNRVWNDDGGSSCAPECEFLYEKWTGSTNTEHALLGAPPASRFRGWLARHERELHVFGSPNRAAAMAEGGRVYAAMVASGDFCADFAPRYAALWHAGVDVLIYAGNLDPLLGAPVVAGAVDAVAGAALANATKRIWRVAADDADPAGYATCADAAARLCFVVVRNSGHEAPSYAPRSAYDLHARFVRRLPFDGAGGGAPTCDACDGAPPFAGPALPGCRHRSPDHTHWHERLRVDFGAGPAI